MNPLRCFASRCIPTAGDWAGGNVTLARRVGHCPFDRFGNPFFRKGAGCLSKANAPPLTGAQEAGRC